MNIYLRIKSKFNQTPWVLPVILGFIPRMIEIVKTGISNDEGFTMWMISYNPIEIIARTARDVHPPGYYLIVKFWSYIFGDSVISIRSLSLIFSLLSIILVYKIVNNIWGKRAAFWSSILVAMSPYFILLGHEARMYGVVVFFITLAVYLYIKYRSTDKLKYIFYFTIAMCIAMYTQYYSIFALVSLWVIVAIFTPGFFKLNWAKSFRGSVGIFDKRWLLANLTLVVLYVPWLQAAYNQITRVSGGYWIRPEWITARTIPGTIMRFFFGTNFDGISTNQTVDFIAYWSVVAIILGTILFLFKLNEKRKLVLSIYLYALLPMVIVFVISKIKSPIYQDRYFAFAAIGLLVLWGILISIIKNKSYRIFVGIIALVLLSLGILSSQRTIENYKMNVIYQSVSAEKTPDDLIVSTSVYSFLDSSQYFGRGNVKLISDGVDGYLESSLFYDKPGVYLISPVDLRIMSGDVWVISNQNDSDKISGIFTDWQKIKEEKAGNIRSTLYTR